jgi:molecular chaperone GrpE
MVEIKGEVPDREAVAAAAAADDGAQDEDAQQGGAGTGASASADEHAAELAEARAEAAELKNEYLRALAETENVRRRAARDREDASKFSITHFARDLLSVADNLKRALDSVGERSEAEDTAFAALVGGIEMTERELASVLQRHGISRIDADGQPFDPHLHEAMFEMPNPDVPQGTVVQVVQEGYRLHDRILRPARVGVAKGGPKPAAVAAERPGGGADPGASVAHPEQAEAQPEGSTRAYEKQGEAGRDGAGASVDEQT